MATTSPPKNQPTYQTVISWLYKFFVAFLAITNALASVNDSINYPLSLISPKVAVLSTIFIGVVWIIAQVALRKRTVLWKIDGNLIKVNSLGSYYKRFALAFILLLWIGPCLNWFNSRPTFSPAKGNEILIVIAKFQLGENVPDSRVYEKIKASIEETGSDLGINNLRVEIDNKAKLGTNDYSKAQALGDKYNATIVIWGTETRVDLQVNFYNIKSFRTNAAKTNINKLIFPDEYPTLVVQDIPNRIKFLSLLTLSDVLSYRNDYEQSLQLINEAIDSVENEPIVEEEKDSVAEAYFRLGLILNMRRDFQKSVEAYSKAIDIAPTARIYDNRGNVKTRLKDYVGAIKDFDKSIELSPDFPLPYNNRGIVHLLQGEYEEAINDHTKAIELWPEYSNAYAMRGQAWYFLSTFDSPKTDLALADLNKAIELNPNHIIAYIIRAEIYLDEFDCDLALTDLNKVIEELNPYDGQAYDLRSQAFDCIGEYDKAQADIILANKYGTEPIPYSEEIEPP